MRNSRFKREKSNLYSLLELVWSILYTNSPAEGHVHSRNEVRNEKRNVLCPLLMCCILHILYTGDAMDDCDGLIHHGNDLWHKIGGCTADAPFSAKDIAVCRQHLENYYESLEMNEKRITDYNKRKIRRERRRRQTKEINGVLTSKFHEMTNKFY